MPEHSPIRIKTRITVRKYEGDPPQPGEDKTPIETIIIEDDGQVTKILAEEPDDGPDQRRT
ncbi:MAG: hypothetical protein ACREM3_18545 [Candidatus Rokuibacteriota bacterium]